MYQRSPRMVLNSTDPPASRAVHSPRLCSHTLCAISRFSWCQDANAISFVQLRCKGDTNTPHDPSTVQPGQARAQHGKVRGGFLQCSVHENSLGPLHSDGHHSDGSHSAAFALRLPLSSSSLLTSLRGDWGSREPSPDRQGCAGCCEGEGAAHDFIRCTHKECSA